ncbi:MAG: 30S ribosomal protein S8 [Bdellovibrionaceae bacterium]|nr:30S ribosomal protein S8 [Pseudobdellovibrionaceae bacterium]
MDTIADFLTRVRNAGLAKHEKVDIPASKVRVGIANVLKDAGFIRNFKVVRDGKQGIMRIYLRYREDGTHVITAIDRKSRPGRRFYIQKDAIPNVRSGFGLAVLSTSKGVMSGKTAAEQNVGGELICTVW